MRRNILGVVGSTELSPAQLEEARQIITEKIRIYQPDAVVSGGAKGIDTLAKHIAQDAELPVIEVLPARQAWAWFRPRNLLIAEICTRLIRIRTVNSKTYGSGWTRDQAAALGKPTEEYTI